MDYACAPPGRKTRLKMTISNTRTVRSGRFLTAPSIRWSRLYMSAHSYAGYAVTFHCILINTWLNQARTTLLITQDKKNTTHSQQDPRNQEKLQLPKRRCYRGMERSSQDWASSPVFITYTLTPASRLWFMRAETCPSPSWTHLERHSKTCRTEKW